jgi:hypothetical protein
VRTASFEPRERRLGRQVARPLSKRRHAAQALAALVLASLAAMILPTPVLASPRWSWTGPVTSSYLGYMSCPSTSLCVSSSAKAVIETSHDPLAGASAKWVSKSLSNKYALGNVSCPSVSLCAAVIYIGTGGGLNEGAMLTSANPAAGASATWAASHVPSGLEDISCASRSLCVAVGISQTTGGALVVTSTDPSRGASATWTLSTPDHAVLGGLYSVSCPSPSLCVAMGQSESGDFAIATSRDPSAGASASWVVSTPDRHAVRAANTEDGMSCPSVSLCVVIATERGTGFTSSILTSTDPGAGASASWSQSPASTRNAVPLDAVSCASATLCVAVGDGTAFVTATPTVSGSWVGQGGAEIVGGALISVGGDYVSCVSNALCVVEGTDGMWFGKAGSGTTHVPTKTPPVTAGRPSVYDGDYLARTAQGTVEFAVADGRLVVFGDTGAEFYCTGTTPPISYLTSTVAFGASNPRSVKLSVKLTPDGSFGWAGQSANFNTVIKGSATISGTIKGSKATGSLVATFRPVRADGIHPNSQPTATVTGGTCRASVQFSATRL